MTSSPRILAPPITDYIFNIRGSYVMLDRDLANIYGVKTKALNQAVKRNKERFPEDFCFQITEEEVISLRSQFVTSKSEQGGSRYLPYAFSEQGVAMLSAILTSDTAIRASIQIMQTFVKLRHTITANIDLLKRIDTIDLKLSDHDMKLEGVLKALEGDFIANQGIFFDGQTYDAYEFVVRIMKSANISIQIIDNYLDETVINLLMKRKKGVLATLYTHSISQEFKLDTAKINSQYEMIRVHVFKTCHDRFIVIDDTTVYHIGASLKDLGKKWFAFSKIDKNVVDNLIDRLKVAEKEEGI